MNRRRFLLSSIACVPVIGCTTKTSDPPPAFGHQASDDASEGYVLGLAADMSGSFARFMTGEDGASDGAAWTFLMDVIDRFMRARLGEPDQIVIAQLSGETTEPLVWQGSGADLRGSMDAEKLNALLRSKSDKQGSAIHDGCAKLINTVMAEPGVANRTKRAVVLILSDMEENIRGDPMRSQRRLVESLKKFAQVNSAFGIFFCDERFVELWRGQLQTAGFTASRATVQSGIKANPPLPSFD